MPDRILHPWIDVKSQINDGYRFLLASLAIRQLPHAAPDLREIALDTFNKLISIPSVRSFDHADFKEQRRFLAQGMLKDSTITSLVICLWAEVAHSLILELREAAEFTGATFQADWDWHTAIQGFYRHSDVPGLNAVSLQIAESKKGQDKNHVSLAVLWLSAALTQDAVVPSTKSAKDLSSETVVSQEQPSLKPPELEPEKMTDKQIEPESILSKVESQPEQHKLNETEGDSANNPTLLSTASNPLPNPSPLEPGEVNEDFASIVTCSEELNSAKQRINALRVRLEDATHRLLKEITTAHLDTSETEFRNLESDFDTWHAEVLATAKTLVRTTRFVEKEYKARSDMQLTGDEQSLMEGSDAKGKIVLQVETLAALLQKFVEYDQRRALLLQERDAIFHRLSLKRTALAVWNEQLLTEGSIDPNASPTTLEALQALVRQMEDEEPRLEQLRKQQREYSLVRVRASIERLGALEIPDRTPVISDLTFGELSQSAIDSLQDTRLLELEAGLNILLETRLLEIKQQDIVELAESYRAQQTEENLLSLLAALARQHRDVEAMLLVLGTGNARERGTPLALSDFIVESLLRAPLHVAPENPLLLLNQISTKLLNGWTCESEAGINVLCIALMGAFGAGNVPISADVLWGLTDALPSNMSGWNSIWHAMLLGAELPSILSQAGPDLHAQKLLAHTHVAADLKREHGGYISLHSLQSRRHTNLLAKKLYPLLEKQVEKLETLAHELETAPQGQQPSLLLKLQKYIAGSDFAASGKTSLEELFEQGMVQEKITDPDGFHTKTALRRFLETGDHVREYAQAISEFWENKLNAVPVLTRTDLLAELKTHPGLDWIGQLALEQLMLHPAPSSVERDETTLWEHAQKQMVLHLLTQTSCALQLPHLVGWLVTSAFELETLPSLLLQDLAVATNAKQSVQILKQAHASTQMILLTSYIDLETQNDAQKLLAEQTKQIKSMQEELGQLGGDATDLYQDQVLGRWTFLAQALGIRIQKQKDAQSNRQQQIQTRQRELRVRWRETEDKILGIQATMPGESYNLVDDGLEQARKAINNRENLDVVREFLDELDFRFHHQAWSPAETRKSVEALSRALANLGNRVKAGFDAASVLRSFEADDLAGLGFGPSDIYASEVATRTELLRNWLRIKELPGFLCEEQKQSERQAIEMLYRYFAQMVKLKHVLTPKGENLDLEDPILHSYRRLQFPKTDVLKEQCILAVLPGSPPRKVHVKQLEDLIDEKKWLEYDFVLLFAPGCDEGIYGRLHSSYGRQRLVIVDEKAMLSMILAETKNRHPLDLLRSQMLDALGARNVEVFHINQLVNPETSIFVGREREIDQIANSDGSYAIYGGRRIGKSSLMMAIRDRLNVRGVETAVYSFEGERDCSDDKSAREIAQALRLKTIVTGMDEFKHGVQARLDQSRENKLTLCIDEIDKYIEQNPKRHLLIESLRSLSDQNPGQLRVIVVGFMKLYECLAGRGPYSSNSNPWPRMFNGREPLGNLHPDKAAKIVSEGFTEILGWDFENRGIPQKVVSFTGGHPAFVQEFCRHLQERVGERGDRCVREADIQAVFQNTDPHQSFIAYVGNTLEMNLDPIGRYLILWLANVAHDRSGFTRDQVKEVIDSLNMSVPEAMVIASLEQLRVTSVVREKNTGYFEFSVPDYPLILERLGYTQDLNVLETKIKKVIYEQTH